jgi:hypothetical protein
VVTAAHPPHDDQPGVNPHPDGEPATFLRLEAHSQLPYGFHHPEPGPHRPRCIIFVRLRIAKVDEQTIAEILRNMALERLAHDLEDVAAARRQLIRQEHAAVR